LADIRAEAARFISRTALICWPHIAEDHAKIGCMADTMPKNAFMQRCYSAQVCGGLLLGGFQ
jgi:hypothetical protein